MGADTVTLRAFVHEYLFISFFKACAESLAGENASRFAAMQRAAKNYRAVGTASRRLPSFVSEWYR
jgi:F0F1-type ATP synthase gamma subunit